MTAEIPTKSVAISLRNPGLNGEGIQPLSDAEIRQRAADEAEHKAAQALAYRDQRRLEYPPITDQLDAIMKWLFTENEFGVPAELKSLAAQCMSVKARHPKPGQQQEEEGGGV